MENTILMQDLENHQIQPHENNSLDRTVTENYVAIELKEEDEEPQMTVEEARLLMEHQLLPPIFVFSAQTLWAQNLQAFVEQQNSTHETSIQENQVIDEKEEIKKRLQLSSQDFQKISTRIQEKIHILCLKDKSKCMREIIHNFFSCILKNSDQMCLCEKVFYDQFMKIYPQNHRSQFRVNGYPVIMFLCLSQSQIFLQRFIPWFYHNKEKIFDQIVSEHFKRKIKQFCFEFIEAQIGFSLNIRLSQSSEGYQKFLNELRDQLVNTKNTGEPVKREEIMPQLQNLCDHICKGQLHKPHSFSHKICQKGFKIMQENHLIENKYITNWSYLMENRQRLFENSQNTEFINEKIHFNHPIAQKENPITKGFFEAYCQIADEVIKPKQIIKHSDQISQQNLQNNQQQLQHQQSQGNDFHFFGYRSASITPTKLNYDQGICVNNSLQQSQQVNDSNQNLIRNNIGYQQQKSFSLTNTQHKDNIYLKNNQQTSQRAIFQIQTERKFSNGQTNQNNISSLQNHVQQDLNNSLHTRDNQNLNNNNTQQSVQYQQYENMTLNQNGSQQFYQDMQIDQQAPNHTLQEQNISEIFKGELSMQNLIKVQPNNRLRQSLKRKIQNVINNINQSPSRSEHATSLILTVIDEYVEKILEQKVTHVMNCMKSSDNTNSIQ